MQAPLGAGALDASTGLSWALRDIDGVRVASHGGGTIGQLALLARAEPSRSNAASFCPGTARVRTAGEVSAPAFANWRANLRANADTRI